MSETAHYTPSRRAVHAEIVPLACTLAAVLLMLLAPGFGYFSQTAHASGNISAIAGPHTNSCGLAAGMPCAFGGQFAHIDAAHLGLNLVGLWLVCWGFKPWRSLRLDLLFLGSGLLGVATGLLLSPDIVWYKGLSGALHGLFCGYAAWICFSDPRKAVKMVALLLLAGLAVKLSMEDPSVLQSVSMNADLKKALEAWLGLSASDASALAEHTPSPPKTPVLYAAHRWGSAAGLFIGTMYAALKRNGPA